MTFQRSIVSLTLAALLLAGFGCSKTKQSEPEKQTKNAGGGIEVGVDKNVEVIYDDSTGTVDDVEAVSSTPVVEPVVEGENDTVAQPNDNTNPEALTNDDTTKTQPEAPAEPKEAATAVRTFAMIGTNFAFSAKELRVKKGDTVVVNFTNEGGMHDWVLDEFNARTARLQTGGTATVTFVADKTGTFEYYCSVGTHRAMGMVGTLIVE